MNTTKLPPMRIITDPFEEWEVEEDAARLIEDAICDGNQFKYAGGNERRTSDNSPIRQACVTVFIDPATRETRYAVEAWNGRFTWKRDYAAKDNALAYWRERRDELGI